MSIFKNCLPLPVRIIFIRYDFEWPEMDPDCFSVLSQKKCHFDCAAPMGILSGSDIVSSVASRADYNGRRMYEVYWFSWGICPIVLWLWRNRLSTLNQLIVFFNLPRDRERSLEDVQIIRSKLHPTHLLFIRFSSIDSKPPAQDLHPTLISVNSQQEVYLHTISKLIA